MKNESYVERYHREQKEKAQKEQKKPQKGKAVNKDGQNTRSERPDTQEESRTGQ